MITANYHEVISLELFPIENTPEPNSVTWRTLKVKTLQDTHLINFFPHKENGSLNMRSAVPSIEVLGPNQTCVRIEDKVYFYSYADCVGFCQGAIRIFRDDNHSLTTKKHITKMCKGFKPVHPTMFYQTIAN